MSLRSDEYHGLRLWLIYPDRAHQQIAQNESLQSDPVEPFTINSHQPLCVKGHIHTWQGSMQLPGGLRCVCFREYGETAAHLTRSADQTEG